MKKIKIAFSGYGDSFLGLPFDQNYLIDVLSERYDVSVTSVPDADYVFCGIWGKSYEYCGVDQVRIMIQGENYTPDFNCIDYAVSPYPIQLYDRNFYVPCGVEALICHRYRHLLSLAERTGGVYHTNDWLKNKKYFANFIASHDSEHHYRSEFFEKLSAYKRIESAGTLYNNMPEGFQVNWRDESKIGFQRKCKFTVCFESTKHEGFVTEKIVDAFLAETIPIYYGSAAVKTIFNEKAFIDVGDYASFDEVIEKIIELDQNDEMYLEMINQPVLKDPAYPEQIVIGFKEYLYHIFDQEPEKAFRRSRVYMSKIYNDRCRWVSEYYYKYPRKENGKCDYKALAKKCIRNMLGDKLFTKIKRVVKPRE